ncbi:unnamed protein product [Cuscuta epithymum]|uniref:Pectin acetylesterase n=1 Tax=Cuscuta epithymum TaxID=186058 RepID=A0AAV0FTV5_9ASTE|nr:unnamed protein product [Cuscuta epithymum]
MQPWEFNKLFDYSPNVSYFYNWNIVVVRYCDGGSFAGDADKPDPVTNLYYRGARIFRAVVKELMMAEGMRKGRNILLAGGSAGGLGVIIHCDRFVRLFSKHNVRVKCLADSSLFLRVQDPLRAKFFDTVFNTVVALHHPHKVLPSKCTKSSNNSTVDCFFPKTLLNYIKSPIFILNPAFDSFQIKCTFGEDLYEQVKNHTVSKTDMVLLQDFRHQIIGALPPAAASDTKNGYLITSIYGHSLGTSSPQSYKGPMFADRNSEPFGSAILDWFFDRTPHVPHLLIDPADQPFYQA